MYTKLFFSLLFLSHVLGDFYFQDNNMAHEKKIKKSVLAKHSFFQFLLSFSLTFVFFGFKTIFISIIVLISHYIIDSLKIIAEKKSYTNPIVLFCLDQLTHILIIFLINPIVEKYNFTSLFINLIDFLRKNYAIFYQVNEILFSQFILLISFVLFLINGGTILTKLFLSQYESDEPKTVFINEITATSENNIGNSLKYGGGELIGILERILIFLFVIINNYEAISFVITAKSIARFKKIQDDKSFSEKFLIGTLSSCSIAIFLGVIFKILIYLFNPNLYEIQ